MPSWLMRLRRSLTRGAIVGVAMLALGMAIALAGHDLGALYVSPWAPLRLALWGSLGVVGAAAAEQSPAFNRAQHRAVAAALAAGASVLFGLAANFTREPLLDRALATPGWHRLPALIAALPLAASTVIDCGRNHLHELAPIAAAAALVTLARLRGYTPREQVRVTLACLVLAAGVLALVDHRVLAWYVLWVPLPVAGALPHLLAYAEAVEARWGW